MTDVEAVKRFQKKYAPNARQDFPITTTCPGAVHSTESLDMHSQLKTIPPQKLPDPWLVDSEFLLNELARLREMMLKIPVHNNSILPINNAIDAIWRTEQQLRYLLFLHRQGQHAFAQKNKPPALPIATAKSQTAKQRAAR
jgi:hypothetical protein